MAPPWRRSAWRRSWRAGPDTKDRPENETREQNPGRCQRGYEGMSKREFDEVWDRDLMRQQLGELRKESARLKQELGRAKKVQDKAWRETAELRRLVQDSHLREKHLRSRYHDLLTNGGGEPAGELTSERASAPKADRVDPAIVERLAENPPAVAGWPTPEESLPALAAHPGWGNYASMGEEGVVIGVSLLGLDHNGRQEVIDLVATQQLRNPQLFPIFLTDDDDFRALRAEHFVFEYLPPWPGEEVVAERARWDDFLSERLALIKKKWGIRRFVSFSSAGYAPRDGSGSDAETVQRELSDAAKER